MQNKINSLFIICLIASMSFLASCSKDDDGPAGSPIVGTWTYNAVDLDITVNNQAFTAFLVSTGKSPAQAAAEEAFLKTILLGDLDLAGSSLTFNADGTYRLIDGNFTESGTYALQNNNTVLALTSDGDTELLDVKELTNNRLVLQFFEEFQEDIDENGVDDNVKLTFDLTLVK